MHWIGLTCNATPQACLIHSFLPNWVDADDSLLEMPVCQLGIIGPQRLLHASGLLRLGAAKARVQRAIDPCVEAQLGQTARGDGRAQSRRLEVRPV